MEGFEEEIIYLLKRMEERIHRRVMKGLIKGRSPCLLDLKGNLRRLNGQ